MPGALAHTDVTELVVPLGRKLGLFPHVPASVALTLARHSRRGPIGLAAVSFRHAAGTRRGRPSRRKRSVLIPVRFFDDSGIQLARSSKLSQMDGVYAQANGQWFDPLALFQIHRSQSVRRTGRHGAALVLGSIRDMPQRRKPLHNQCDGYQLPMEDNRSPMAWASCGFWSGSTAPRPKSLDHGGGGAAIRRAVPRGTRTAKACGCSV